MQKGSGEGLPPETCEYCSGLIRREFLGRMLQEIFANRRKGDWSSWAPEPMQGMEELYHHVGKLRHALDPLNRELVSEYCADIANIVMKIEEVHGAAAMDKLLNSTHRVAFHY